ncbi:MAG: hypothetical protein AB7M05_19255 [Alphaproteobacteria bacterium]
MTEFLPRLRDALAELAAERRTETYKDLAVRVRVLPPHTIHKLTLALEALIREDAAAGRPLLAALVISRAPAGLPGRGFFLLAEELGLYAGSPDGPDARAFHDAELARIFATK